MENQELKNNIKDFFVKINEDKFTKVKYITSNNSFNLDYQGFSCRLEYRRKDDVDLILFIFTHIGLNDTLDLRNSKMYIILDDDKTIELLNSQVLKTKEIVSEIYTSSCQIEVEVSDFISLVNANKLEYSFRCESGSVDGLFSRNSSVILKGFYNSVFDEEYELDNLAKYISSNKSEPNIWEINKLKVLGSVSEVPIIIDAERAVHLAKNGATSQQWPPDKLNFKGQVLFGISTSKAGSMNDIVGAIFTDYGIYTNNKINFVSYKSEPNFTLSTSLLYYTIKDNKSGFEITLYKILALSKEKCKIIIDYINAQIQKFS